MVDPTGTERRESGTGQDTPKVCVLSRPAYPLRPAGLGGTLSHPVPLSRIEYAVWPALRWLAGSAEHHPAREGA
jgi:hypothetical protein